MLLYGPPGTGKTLLARAVAGEAGVPFYSISGSDFVEMFVGVGASRVRDLFEQAKANAPAIVFVDEIDAVGRHRGAGLGGGHDEREQTLNQLLVEMDGFDVKTSVILIAATNRPDILDPALLRPGRFDRQIAVDAPDLIGRHQILEVHAKGKPMAPASTCSPSPAARPASPAPTWPTCSTRPRCSPPAATEADRRRRARRGDRPRHRRPAEAHPDHDRQGEARSPPTTRVATRSSPRRCHTDPVTKITILPRGRALGYTMVLPTDDKYSTTRNEMLDQLAYAMGGRAAEELVFHDPTTGAANDIEKATGMARKMVTQYGMSERIGAIKLGQSQGEVFLGRDMGHQRDYSEEVAAHRRRRRCASSSSARTTRPGTSSTRTATSSTTSCSSCSRTRRSTRSSRRSSRRSRKRPLRPTWLSSETRLLSDQPPVLTPAEKAAQNGTPTASSRPARPPHGRGDRQGRRGGRADADEHPPTQAIEVPEGGQVDPDEH